VAVDWAGFDRDFPRRRLPLPTYPFQRERYWLPQEHHNVFRVDSATGSSGEPQHPLLGRRLRSALKEIQYEQAFRPDSPAYLRDHQVYSSVIFPASAYLEMALAAGAAIKNSDNLLLENIRIKEPLLLSDSETQAVQFILTPEENEAYSLQIASEADTGGWRRHVDGRLSIDLDAAVDQAQNDFEIALNHCQEEIPGSAFYEVSRHVGFNFGPAFRGVQKVWRGDREAIGLVALPPNLASYTATGSAAYQIQPVLLDAALQIFGAAVPDLYEHGVAYVPVGVDHLHFFRRRGNIVWSHVIVEDNNGRALTLSYRLFNEEKQLVAAIDGFHVRQIAAADLERLSGQEGDNWLYEINWRPTSNPVMAVYEAKKVAGHWLIFADDGGLGREIEARLEQNLGKSDLVYAGKQYRFRDGKERELDPAQPGHFKDLVADLEASTPEPLRGIVYLWGLDQPEPSFEPNGDGVLLTDAQASTCGGLLHLVQALADSRIPSPPRIWLATRGSQAVTTGSETISVAQAPLWGLGGAIAQEHPDLWGGRIDLDLGPGVDEAGMVLAEILYPNGEEQVAYREQTRFLPRLGRLKFSSQTTEPFSANGSVAEDAHSPIMLREDSSYLIAGGFGALGLQVGEWMVDRGARNLILIGRNSITEAVSERLQSLEERGVTILSLKADIADRTALAEALAQVALVLPPIRGIIHTAGVLADGWLAAQPWELFAQPLPSKVDGAWNLHVLSRELPLDFFVMFSSAATILGSPGQANYTAANAFLDALAYHRRKLGLTGLSINWGPWAEAGMAAVPGHTGHNRWATYGVHKIDPDSGRAILDRLLFKNLTQVGVFPIEWTQLFQQSAGSEPSFLSEMRPDQQTLPAEDAAPLLDELSKLLPQEREPFLRRHLRERSAAVLGLGSAQQLDPDDSLSDLGLDSLMAVNFTESLEAIIGRRLPATLLFNYPSIASLAAFLNAELATEIPAAFQTNVSHDHEEPDSDLSVGALADILQEIEGLSEEEMDAILAEALGSESSTQNE
jgi:acyl transferase domain-containing protein/acyl carrier protein